MIFANVLFTSIFSFLNLFMMSIIVACLIAMAINHTYGIINCIYHHPNNLFWERPHYRHHHVHRHDDANVHIHGR